ncbi:flavodoxin [Eubacterium sp.]|uniref:flavodoxin n=1 Tax=Eubacterium sp. TaxID=142586 RepID=UPI002FCA8C77
MSKIAVVYWSGTGNTEVMANAVAKGIVEKGAEAVVLTPDGFDEGMIDDFDGIAFGCPAMGAEVLEESEFEPMFEACQSKLTGKPIALFGSYGWGDGEWMRCWEESCEDVGIHLVCESVICVEEPDTVALEACKELGAELVA